MKPGKAAQPALKKLLILTEWCECIWQELMTLLMMSAQEVSSKKPSKCTTRHILGRRFICLCCLSATRKIAPLASASRQKKDRTLKPTAHCHS